MKLCISREALKRKIMEDDYEGSVEAGCGPVSVRQSNDTKSERWFHTDDSSGPTMSEASLGRFFKAVLTAGGKIGSVHAIDRNFDRSPVSVTVLMTDEMKDAIEARSKFRFKLPSGAPAYWDPA